MPGHDENIGASAADQTFQEDLNQNSIMPQRLIVKANTS
jgi:hypothetical protein